MPDIPLDVHPEIVTVIAPNGAEVHGLEAIRAHMERLPEKERDTYRCVLKSGLRTSWPKLHDTGPHWKEAD